MAKSTGTGLPTTRTVISEVRVATSLVKRRDLGSLTTKTVRYQEKHPSAMGNMKVFVSPIMRTGTVDRAGFFLNI